MPTRQLNACDAAKAPDAIAEAASILCAGGLVAFPTETVYGLGADATSESAVQKVFHAKGRPSNNPLIVHVASAEHALDHATRWPAEAQRLAQAFWPGPLTLVLPAGPRICRTVLAGGSTVGLRVPNHPVALALIRAAGCPIAAPSANRSEGLSPTSAAAVLDTLEGRIDAVLDGGECNVGIESTVLDLTDDTPRILRPGGITAAQISRVLNRTILDARGHSAEVNLRSPGMLPRHYAPRVPLVLCDAPRDEAREDDFIITIGPSHAAGPRELMLPDSAEDFARLLYSTLRHAERSGAARILMQSPPQTQGWEAINDRLRRASFPRA